MKLLKQLTVLAVAAALPLTADAHRAWMLPSSTVLSGDAPWVTVDAAAGNGIFYFDHFPMMLEGVGTPPANSNRQPAPLTITAPDGSEVAPQNGHLGRLRSSFDLQLEQKGTYKIAIANSGRVMGMYELNGERERVMGSLDDIVKQIPADAERVNIIRSDSRMELFVTSGNPTEDVLNPSGQGLELQPVTHPNDLYADEAAEFVFLLDGQPAPGLEITLIPAGSRYRDSEQSRELTTDADGKVSIEWGQAGLFWLEAEYKQVEGLEAPVTQRRASYSTTLEVLAP